MSPYGQFNKHHRSYTIRVYIYTIINKILVILNQETDHVHITIIKKLIDDVHKDIFAQESGAVSNTFSFIYFGLQARKKLSGLVVGFCLFPESLGVYFSHTMETMT